MKGCLLLLTLFTVPLTAQAQASLEGRWAFVLTMPEGQEMHMEIDAEVAQDTLHLTMMNDRGALPLDNVSLEEDALRFEINTDHGSVQCTLYKEADDGFAGLCAGPAGESPTTMKRPAKAPNQGQ